MSTPSTTASTTGSATASRSTGIDPRWIALGVLCLGSLMIVLDTTIVNVALPSIQSDLGFSDASLAWVVNAYMLTFGGFLLLAGRLGDYFGARRMFLGGIVLFTSASVVCGLAGDRTVLVVARATQGLGGAVVSAVGLALIMRLFTEPGDRAKAMGVFGFVAAGGGSVGVFLGGVLTDLFSWHWVFLVNLPVGVFVYFAAARLLPSSEATAERNGLDITGAVTITSALTVLIYAIVDGNEAGWASTRTLGLFAVAIVLVIAFLVTETRTASPLVPLRLFLLRNLAAANAIGILWTAAMFAWFFLSALYMQLVLGYSPLQVGCAFLPGNIIMAAFSLGISAKLVMRFGIRAPLTIGLVFVTVGLALFARSPVDGSFVTDVLPSMLLLGFGAGMALNPLLLAAMNDVEQDEAGLASGIMNTSLMLGGAVGLAVLASVAALRTEHAPSGTPELEALTQGYHLAFLGGALFALSATVIAAVFVRAKFSAVPEPT